ncbi:nodulation protein NodH [Actibacterium sp. D379-3]
MAKPFDYFVLFAEMRTGSNFLEANLNEFDAITCHGEAFNPHFIGHKDKTQMLGVTMAERVRDPLRLISAMKGQGGALPGFRFFHDHDARVLAHVLADPRCAKIVLTRNPVESYVSLKIATRTGQWKLTDMKDQRTATIRFDGPEFSAFLDQVQGFQRTLLHSLQASGQTAFYLAYEDIQDLDVLNGLARYLGVEQQLAALSGTLKKQNPAPLSEKVSNYDQMHEALARLDRFDLTRTPNFEPRRGPAVPGYVAAAKAPLLFMPVKAGPVAQVEAWLGALDGGTADGLRRDFTQKTLRQWKRQHPGHRSFTVVTHPVARAYRSFCDHILTTGPGSFGMIRDTLIKTYKLPLPRDEPGPDFGPAPTRAAFLAFLKFLKGHLGGQTSLRVDPAWTSQDAVIQGMTQFALPDMVMRAERLGQDLAQVAGQVGLTSPAPLPDEAKPPRVPLSAIYDAEIESAARDAYQRDYMVFGYRAWG